MNRVLCIQSSVVHGYVGNRVAQWAYNCMGVDVDGLNTCYLSNHTGYAHFSGSKASKEELLSMYASLNENQFEYTQIQSGYTGSVEVLETIEKIVLEQQVPYLLDPVM